MSMEMAKRLDKVADHFSDMADESRQRAMSLAREALIALTDNNPATARGRLLSALQECDEMRVKQGKAEVLRKAASEV